MVAVGGRHALGLVHEVGVDIHAAVELHAMVGPARSLGLEVESHLVGRREGRLGRTVAMEAHGVETILLALSEHCLPALHIGGGIAREWEIAVAHRATNPHGLPVEVNLHALDGDLAHAERGADGVVAGAHRQAIDARRKLGPQLGVGHGDDVGGVVVACGADGLAIEQEPQLALGRGHHHTRHTLVDVGEHGHAPHGLATGATQLHAPHNAVPVALCLVGDAMRVLADTHVLDAIVDGDGDAVVAPEGEVRSDVVDMRRVETHLVAHLQAVHLDGGLDVGALQEKLHAAPLPRLGNHHRARVGHGADVMAVGGEEEGKLHVARLAILLHVGVEVERRVVERPRPLGVDRWQVAKVVGEHGAGQRNGMGGAVERGFPGATKAHHVACKGLCAHAKKTKQKGMSHRVLVLAETV